MKNFKHLLQSKTNFQLVLIFIVFAVNGSLSAKIGALILKFSKLDKDKFNIILYYLILAAVVTLIYPFLIIVIGSIFGQFDYFFTFSKNMLNRIGLGFVFRTKTKELK